MYTISGFSQPLLTHTSGTYKRKVLNCKLSVFGHFWTFDTSVLLFTVRI